MAGWWYTTSLDEGNVLGRVVGSSGYLGVGTHRNVTVRPNQPFPADATLIAMARRDTDSVLLHRRQRGDRRSLHG
ncbi:DUF7282 domain-containing protein [Haloplanus sp.]|uniref:DUF7282 domain-containing protein n=1 Tax=Haloplanus sp. TaxID=1961696 RepID=UPI003BB99DD2